MHDARVTRVGLAAAFLLAACLPTAPKYEIKLPEKHATLPNGMRVLLLPDPSTELVEVDVRYEVGAAEDPAGKAGLAHLVEHLMFDQHQAGADKPALGVVLRQHSIYFNAYTVWDSTHYQTLAQADELPNLLALEASRLATGCQTIDEATFAREREVVRNEIRLRSGTAEEQVLSKVLALAYPEGHPYGREVGGDDAQLASLTLADACAFMKDYYVPERATIIVAGHVSEEEASALVDQYLAGLEARPGKPRAEIPPVALARRTVTLEADVDEASVFAVWALPRRFTAEDAAFGYLIGAVTGRAAGLGARYEVSSEVRPHILGGARAPMLALEVRLRDESKLDDALDLLWKSAASAHRGIENDQDFREEKVRRVGYLTLALEALAERTNSFGDYAQFDRDGNFFAGELERARALSGDDVRAIVKRTLATDKAVVVIVKPKKGAGLYQRAGGGFRGAGTDEHELPVDRAEAAVPIPVPARLGPLAQARRFELPNGLHVALLPTDQPLPIITAAVVFGAGSAHEPAEQAGLAQATARALEPPVGGARGEVNALDGFGELGIEAAVRTTSDYTVFTIRGLTLYQDLMLQGLERMIKMASFGQESFEKLAERQELRLRRRAVRAQEAAQRRLAEALFGADHPYARTAVPTPQTLGRIGYDAARGFAQGHYVAANATLVVAGRFDAAQVEREIRAKFGEWDRGRADPPVVQPHAARKGAVYLGIDGEDAPVVQVRLAYPALAAKGEDAATRLVLAQMLTQRVEAVRSKLGASYGVYARYARRTGPSSYEIGGALDAERAAEALRAIHDAVDGLRRGEGFLEEFVRARRRVLEQLLVNANDSESLAGALVEIAAYGLPATAVDDLRRSVGAATPQAVLKLVNAELRPDGEVIVAVGPRARVQAMFEGAGLTGVSFEK